MTKKSRWIVLTISLVFIYAIGYFVYINTTTDKLILGVIPEFLVYLISGYFISSILIEILVGESPNRNIKRALIKSLILLLFFISFIVVYWIFYKYIIIANDLKNTFIGDNSYLILLMIMIFLGIKFANKLDSK